MLYITKRIIWAAALGLCLILTGCGGEKITLSGAEEFAAEGPDGSVLPETGAADLRTGAVRTDGADGTEGLSENAGNGTGSTAPAGRVAVHICGEVENPGVYELPAGSRLEAALKAAGGFTDKADEASVNLAAEAADGSQIVVRAEGEEPLSGPGAVDADGTVDLNRATLQELCTLPGIGETRAEAILSYREQHGAFQKPEELMRVNGIKEGSYAKLKDKIKVK